MSQKDLPSYVSDLHEAYRGQLAHAALDYLKSGTALFHQYRRMTVDSSPQAALGNLSVAVELMLKAFIAGKQLTLLFKGLPLETRVLLTCPESLPTDFNWRPFDMDIRSAKHEAIELGECISVFFVFFPDLRQSLQPYLRLLTTIRNNSVHFVLPAFHKYEIERMAYVALQVYQVLQKRGNVRQLGYKLTKDDTNFLSTFQEELVERVRKQIEEAKERSKRLSSDDEIATEIASRWENYPFSCPVCGNQAVLIGNIHVSPAYADDEVYDEEEGLTFNSHSFLCDACKLELSSSAELSLAGIPLSIDRTDEFDDYVKGYIQDYLEEQAVEEWKLRQFYEKK